ncbi:NAD+ synthase [Desulfurococcaceae archaeon MEX13E-LK6-19]|nr:NAD+ synthase [Desulfurococcaceae archaeon MEX13E-LK6-19]
MKRITISDLLNFDINTVENTIKEFIREIIENSGAKGVVIGLSGGVDSSTAAALAVKALGNNRVHGLIMPDPRTTPEADVKDAIDLAKKLGINYTIIDISKIYDSFAENIPFFNADHNIACGNLRARIRMILLYYYANLNNYLVLGSGDRSEILIGYFTKYGDGATDLMPLGCLYKTQVRHLAKYLGIPEKIYNKPSSPRLWPGHMAEEELGMKYTEIDLVLYSLFDLGLKPEEIPEATGISIEKVQKIIELHRKSRHKRGTPPIPSLPNVPEPIKEL